ncbi:low molecular weight protein-tyrosine-phosphatase [Rheinheimera maricola]|uniref:protein-tyrosine-phosphatase n=1 Tax=Rheinheimera maricola TaxID=2793282 RepID=A0ABS7X624_9GAMM|nr:low molecular weight protein-tyrosine-phosphatase [Rheinheimera maricola]MBZ9610998.1 low molecular weight phosphotyrosine protein phosphatase [Rheinheimera maricola]
MAKKILFVCLGNICRSPTAHAVMRHKAQALNIDIEIESAGTSASHRGEKPDPRSVREGNAVGYRFEGITSRPVKDGDFDYYDVILAMDNANLLELQRRCPKQLQHKLQLFMQYNPRYPALQEVPDPYYGGGKGFTLVLNLIEQGCDGLLAELSQSKLQV